MFVERRRTGEKRGLESAESTDDEERRRRNIALSLSSFESAGTRVKNAKKFIMRVEGDQVENYNRGDEPEGDPDGDGAPFRNEEGAEECRQESFYCISRLMPSLICRGGASIRIVRRARENRLPRGQRALPRSLGG